MKITLQILQNGTEILSRVFEDGVYRIGRSDFSDIVLKNDAVSRSHLELRVTEVAVYMTNMSTNGKVKLNGEILETAEVMDGDEIGIGPYRILLFHGDRAGEMAPAGFGADAPAPDAEPVPEEPVADAEPPAEENAEAPPPDNLFQLPQNDGGGLPEDPEPHRELSGTPQFASEGTAALRVETVVEAKPVVAKLIFEEGARKGEDLFLEAYEVTIGRSKKADIHIDDEKLSRLHAKIVRVGMGYRLVDLNSRHGTYVNGVRVLEHPLSSFDNIELGNCKIRFLIHDLIASPMGEGALMESRGGRLATLEQTKSLQMAPAPSANALGPSALSEDPFPMQEPPPLSRTKSLLDKLRLSEMNRRTKVILIVCAVLLVGVLFIPGSNQDTKTTTAPPKDATSVLNPPSAKIPPALSKEYNDLSPEEQRIIEGNYNTAIRAAEKDNYEEAVAALKKIHEKVPYYKQSQDLLQQYMRELRTKQITQAQEKAKRDQRQELQDAIEDGVAYLKEGDFDQAADAFNAAIGIDPNNDTATKGLKAAQLKVRRIEDLPPERDPEMEKRAEVQELFGKANLAMEQKNYPAAIEAAEKIRTYEIKGDTQYLNMAKQVIDNARLKQREDVEPWVINAKEKYAEGDFNTTRDLCEEILRKHPTYEEVKDLLAKTNKQLNLRAKEAYTYGYILESMNRLEEAKQYWNRAKNFVRPGDDYYDKVMKKLEFYQ